MICSREANRVRENDPLDLNELSAPDVTVCRVKLRNCRVALRSH